MVLVGQLVGAQRAIGKSIRLVPARSHALDDVPAGHAALDGAAEIDGVGHEQNVAAAQVPREAIDEGFDGPLAYAGNCVVDTVTAHGSGQAVGVLGGNQPAGSLMKIPCAWLATT